MAVNLNWTKVLLDWVVAAGLAKSDLHKAVADAFSKVPALAGYEDSVQQEIKNGLVAAGADPVTAAALALKAIGEIKGGTAGYDPQAFGGVG